MFLCLPQINACSRHLIVACSRWVVIPSLVTTKHPTWNSAASSCSCWVQVHFMWNTCFRYDTRAIFTRQLWFPYHGFESLFLLTPVWTHNFALSTASDFWKYVNRSAFEFALWLKTLHATAIWRNFKKFPRCVPRIASEATGPARIVSIDAR